MAATSLVVASACPRVAHAAAPILEHLYPPGGRQGTTVDVTAAGAFEPWPVSGWADHQGIHIEPAADKGKLSIRIEADVPAGPHLVRLFNAEGASAPRVFVIGEAPEVVESEPNNELSQAGRVDVLPATLHGRLDPRGDVDSYAVKLEAGQTLVASVQGRRLGAPMDALLHLHDEAGNPVAFVHDGFGLDPLLVYRAERAAVYVVRIAAFADPPAADVSFTGGPNAIYRLSLTAGPFARYAFPLGVPRGAKSTVTLFGWNLAGEGATSDTREVDATQAPAGQDHVMVHVPGGEHRLRVELGDVTEFVDTDANAGPRTPPVTLDGRIGEAGESDVLRFTAKKDEKLLFALRAGAAGSPLDATLGIRNEAGEQLAEDDDAAGSGDPRLEWAAPADGVYRTVVSDLNGLGGPDFVYRLTVRPAGPTLGATPDAHEYRVAPGATVAIKLAVTRAKGGADKLVAAATELPAGVTCADVEVPADAGEVTLTLSAAADAKPAGGPIRIFLRVPDPQQPASVTARYYFPNDGGQTLLGGTDAVWLTVLPAPKS